MIEKGNAIGRRYDAWIKLQNLYMPAVAAYRESLKPDPKIEEDDASIHDAHLLMPSDLVGTGTRFSRHLAAHEFRFRVAHAHTTLEDLRGQVMMRQQLYISKKRHASGTIQSTRSNTILATLGVRIKRCAAKYRDTYQRLLKLKPYATSKHACDADGFKPLLDSDITALSSMVEGPEKGKHNSWIWHMQGIGETSDDHSNAGTLHTIFTRHST